MSRPRFSVREDSGGTRRRACAAPIIRAMKIFRGGGVPRQQVDPKSFIGSAHVKKLAEHSDGIPVIVYHVEFESGARTNWHLHSGPQWLLVTEGRIRIQKWGEAALEVTPGTR